MNKEEKMIERRVNLRHKIEFLELLVEAWWERDPEYVASVRKRLLYNKKLMVHMKDV